MKLRFYVSVGLDGITFKDRVKAVADALKEGAAVLGDEVEFVHNGVYDGPQSDVDVACVWGVMGNSREIVRGYVGAGKRVLMFDKALIRRLGNDRGYYRVGIDGPSPLKYLMRAPRDFRRWEEQRVPLRPRNQLGADRRGAILYAGSSQKYCDFYDLGDANDYAEGIFRQVRDVSRKAELIYRPKPSWPDYRLIEGTRHSGKDEALLRVLKLSHCMVTHGSAAALEAIVAGVPVVALGPCVATPVANKSIDDIRNPYFPSDHARFQWLCNVAWCQWSGEELASGEAWTFLKGELEATA